MLAQSRNPFFGRILGAAEVGVAGGRPDPDPARQRQQVERAFARQARVGHQRADLPAGRGGDPGHREPYERLLGDALRGERGLFTDENQIEQTWRIVQPLLDDPPPVEPYKPGTWGPVGAKALCRGICEWYEPWMPDPGGPVEPPS